MPLPITSQVKKAKKKTTPYGPVKGTLPNPHNPAAAKPVTLPVPQGYVPPVPKPSGPAPVSVQGGTIRSDAEKAMQGATTDYRDSAYRAIMALGDPTLIEKYKTNPNFAGYNFVVDPTSTFSQLAEGERLGLEDVNNRAVQGNTFFSGLRLNDRGLVNQNFANQRATASNAFQEALANYARTLTGAQGNYNQAMRDADAADIAAQIANTPEPSQLINRPQVSPTGVPIKGNYDRVTPTPTKKAKKKGK